MCCFVRREIVTQGTIYCLSPVGERRIRIQWCWCLFGRYTRLCLFFGRRSFYYLTPQHKPPSRPSAESRMLVLAVIVHGWRKFSCEVRCKHIGKVPRTCCYHRVYLGACYRCCVDVTGIAPVNPLVVGTTFDPSSCISVTNSWVLVNPSYAHKKQSLESFRISLDHRSLNLLCSRMWKMYIHSHRPGC